MSMHDVGLFSPPKKCDRPYTVSEVNGRLAQLIEKGVGSPLWIQGEISNFKCASSGHCYFNLKDGASRIPAVLWRSVAQKIELELQDGCDVTVIASVRVYQKGGYYQLDVHRIQPAGIGALMAAFQRLKEKLAKEGLFDAVKKKSLPASIHTLGVITSKHGAAIRDIITVAAQRAPQTNILLLDVPVQGVKAADAIAAAITAMNDYGKADCLIVGRGGGSVEDLWAFNEEVVARAIYSSKKPIISAVGHEIDFTIADFTADVRAPTPSAAAEMALGDQQQNRRYVEIVNNRFLSLIRRYFRKNFDEFASLVRRPALRFPLRLLRESIQHRDMLEERIVKAAGAMLASRYARLRPAHARLEVLNPHSIMARGYSIVTNTSGTIVKDAGLLFPDESISIRFRKGKAFANIREVEH